MFQWLRATNELHSSVLENSQADWGDCLKKDNSNAIITCWSINWDWLSEPTGALSDFG